MPRNFVAEPFCAVFQKVSGTEKIYGKEGGVSRFCVEIFLSHSDEKCRRGTVQSFIMFGYRKSLDERVGGSECQTFRWKILCLTVPEFFVGQTFRVSLLSGLEKFYASEGYVINFCRNFLSHSVEKFRMGTLLCCVSEKFW